MRAAHAWRGLDIEQGVPITMTIRALADAAAIILVAEVLILGLVPLALLGGMAYGVTRLIRALRPILKRIQDIARRVAAQSERVSQAATRPLIEVASRAAAGRAYVSTLRADSGRR